jgi:hypothetical protein
VGPDIDGLEAILKIHFRDVFLADLHKVASHTQGFVETGNLAVLLAAREKEMVGSADHPCLDLLKIADRAVLAIRLYKSETSLTGGRA